MIDSCFLLDLIRFVRLLVFTLEVAVSCMSRFVDQFVLLFDASKQPFLHHFQLFP